METSYFAKTKSAMSKEEKTKCFNISNMNIGQIPVLREVVPSWGTVQKFKNSQHTAEDVKQFIVQYYQETLSKLDPMAFYMKYKDSILLCCEGVDQFCHRRVIANWLKLYIHVDVEEFDTPEILLNYEGFIYNILSQIVR